MAKLKAPYFDAYFSAPVGRLPKRFAIVTAHNPRGKKSPALANKRRDATLRRRLNTLKMTCFRVTGGNESGSHREAGWGIVVPSPGAARALAAAFDQDAYYWISAGRIFLGSAAGGRLRSVGSWSARQADW